jgi:hypothetical protein
MSHCRGASSLLDTKSSIILGSRQKFLVEIETQLLSQGSRYSAAPDAGRGGSTAAKSADRVDQSSRLN